MKPARQYQPQGSVTVGLLVFWHPQPATTHVESWHARARFGARKAGGKQVYAGKSSARSDSSWGALEQLAAWLWCLRLRAQWSSTRVREI